MCVCSSPLSEVFRSSGVALLDEEGDLERALAARVDAGRQAWPALHLPEADFVRDLARLSARSGHLPPRERAADVWLTCACAQGVAGAPEAFAGVCRSVVARAVARLDRGIVDDVVQSVMTHLLVRASNTPPAIATFRGQVSLSAWLRTVALRRALNMKRGKADGPHRTVSSIAQAAAGVEPAVQIARARYGPIVDRALAESVRALPAADRELLRLHHGGGWTIDRLAARFGTSRSKTSRRLIACRRALLEATRTAVQSELGVTAAELDSLLEVVRSGLRVSLLRLLGEDSAPHA
jgi:RNA polymerase sigma-70 factor (ECF subfamily)